MAITPFDEGTIVRTTTAPVSGGYADPEVDKFRQGVEITTERHRADGVLLRLNTTRNLNHQVEPNIFGQDGMFTLNENLFVDGDRHDPSQRVNTSSLEAVADGPFSFNGVIEPLTIRDKVTGLGVESPFFAHDVFGNLQGGNEDPLKRSDQILQFIPLPAVSASVQEPWLDSEETAGSTNGAIRIPGYIMDEVRLIRPFDDSASGTLFSGAPGEGRAANNQDVVDALRDMTGSVDNDFRPFKHKSATAGFIYENNTEIGTDSIAFGGLKR
jgi:hypothetical protein